MDGGSDRIKYFFNLGYLKQEGSYKSGSLNYDRWNFRSNIDAKITNRLKATVALSGYMKRINRLLIFGQYIRRHGHSDLHRLHGLTVTTVCQRMMMKCWTVKIRWLQQIANLPAIVEKSGTILMDH